ncbi:MAG: 2-C-methyl-D-erythritol 2,4-cyclodiphosphate synthase [Chloroflexi bacterium]|jgi:2-C-methyl-D-erythritol 2,4-cyclodiphosphate synthase|nr:MAG: 2-C-methyl-D-erythritol 2,4-cyclodiphosphate synthase [Chloroflexota bacterium]
MNYRTGIGIDIHPLVLGRKLILGGIDIPYKLGLQGNSDGDVLIHAIIDAMLGASGLGDIGLHFPTNDPEYKNAASTDLLVATLGKLTKAGWKTIYLDATILAQEPVLRPYISNMESCISKSLGIANSCINLKATTTDNLGFIGESKGIGGLAIATIEKLN